MENRNTKILENLKKEINLLASDMEKQDAAEFYSELADWAYANGEAMLMQVQHQLMYYQNQKPKKTTIMEKIKHTTVVMTAEEKAEFEAFQREKAKKAAEEKAKNDREMYKQMVDEEIANSIPVLLGISEQIKASKQTVMDNFKTILEMKADLFKTKVKDDQRSHTFTNSEGDKRITLGVYVTDGYRDTVEDGIAIVKEYIEGLAKDEKTKALVSMVLRLLARDAKGTLKASRIVQLRKVAMETGDERFIEGVRIIEEAYQPEVSKQFIRAEIKNENGMWKPIPLGMTES